MRKEIGSIKSKFFLLSKPVTLRGDTLEFLSSSHKQKRNLTARNSDKPVLKLVRGKGIKKVIICWLPWKRGLPVVTVFLAKHKDSGTRNCV